MSSEINLTLKENLKLNSINLYIGYVLLRLTYVWVII